MLQKSRGDANGQVWKVSSKDREVRHGSPQEGHAEERLRAHRQEPQAGDRNRPQRGARERREGARAQEPQESRSEERRKEPQEDSEEALVGMRQSAYDASRDRRRSRRLSSPISR